MTKTVTCYYVVNAKGQSLTTTYKESEKEKAIEKLNYGLKRGWKWEIRTFERVVGKPAEDWELAACKQDSRKVNWGRNWMKNY